MHKVVGLISLLVILELSGQVSGQCRFNVGYIQKSLGTLTTHDANGKLQLLRFSSVDEGTKLTLHCIYNIGEIIVDKETSIECRNGTLMPSDPDDCGKKTNEAEVKLTDKDQSCPATMYSIGIKIGNDFHELYRACYDKENVRTYFSEASVYWKPIHPSLAERPFFSTDKLITPAQAASFQTRKIYNAFKTIYGKTQSYIRNNKDLVINRGHLTASSDMLFSDQMTSTFKLLNVVPQFRSINDGNWLQIEHWVGNNIPKMSVVHVRTGAFGVLSLLKFKPKRSLQPAYLIPNKKQNPVPEWMYKIVRDAKNNLLHVFLTYNNIFNATKTPAPECCKIVECPLKLADSAALGFSYCCDPEHFVKNVPKQ